MNKQWQFKTIIRVPLKTATGERVNKMKAEK